MFLYQKLCGFLGIHSCFLIQKNQTFMYINYLLESPGFSAKTQILENVNA